MIPVNSELVSVRVPPSACCNQQLWPIDWLGSIHTFQLTLSRDVWLKSVWRLQVSADQSLCNLIETGLDHPITSNHGNSSRGQRSELWRLKKRVKVKSVRENVQMQPGSYNSLSAGAAAAVASADGGDLKRITNILIYCWWKVTDVNIRWLHTAHQLWSKSPETPRSQTDLKRRYLHPCGPTSHKARANSFSFASYTEDFILKNTQIDNLRTSGDLQERQSRNITLNSHHELFGSCCSSMCLLKWCSPAPEWSPGESCDSLHSWTQHSQHGRAAHTLRETHTWLAGHVRNVRSKVTTGRL